MSLAAKKGTEPSRGNEGPERYRIHHLTAYDYGQPVTVSHQVARLRPIDGEGQVVHHFELTSTPAPSRQESGRDYFGNPVERFSLQELHRRLEVLAVSDVEVNRPVLAEKGMGLAWDRLREKLAADRQDPAVLRAEECCYASPLISPSSAYADYAASSFDPERPGLEAVMDLTERIHEDFTFDPTATTVATPVEEVMENRRGVCQDFAQFEIACLRSLGLPARYVSGYLRTDPPPGSPRLIGADAMHAWVEFYCPDLGWVGVDPTNRCLARNHHVRIAVGRDYNDVSPLRGTVVGGGSQLITIAVTVRPFLEGDGEPMSSSQSQSQRS